MKNLIISALILLAMYPSATAQSSCSKYYPLSEGTKFEISVYDKKEKPTAVINYHVTDVRQSGGNEIGTVHSRISDENGKEIAATSYEVSCSGDVVSIDFKSMINPQIFEQFGDMEYEITGTNIDMPNNLSVGQQLEDANMDMKINMGGINMNMTMSITDRKVIAKESVTTSAGTYNCFVLTYTSDMKMGISQQSTGKQWVAEGVGMVKSENYDKKGKTTSKSLLTKFSK